MIKVAVLDDYQNIFKEIVEIEKLKKKFSLNIYMKPILLFGEPINMKFFTDLLVDQDSKYLTNFKKYFK